MTFFLSKFLWFILNPFNLFIYFLILAFFFNYINFKKISKLIFSFTILFFIFSGILPTGSYLNYLLEKDFHDTIILPKKVDGILILSGASNPNLTKEYNKISLNDSAERLTESIILINKYPNAKIIFSGGSGSLNPDAIGHSYAVKLFFENLNINLKNIIFENKSRNTYENILFSKNKAKPQSNEIWIVITSAFHLKRTLNIAKKLEWNLLPYPTDFKQSKKFEWKISFNFLNNFLTFQNSSHEWMGLAAYYWMGRTSKIY
tara:strand:- start:237 stop:1019 length:783 start_codon:yes stop_codon:yes gene_type:complete